jgi:hypothetical protein
MPTSQPKFKLAPCYIFPEKYMAPNFLEMDGWMDGVPCYFFPLENTFFVFYILAHTTMSHTFPICVAS